MTKVTMKITDFATTRTKEQDSGAGVIRFNSGASEFQKSAIKRNDLLRIRYVKDNIDNSILALFRDARDVEKNQIAFEYDQRLQLFKESALDTEKTIEIIKVSKINMFRYLWDHPKLDVKYNFRVNFVYSLALTLAGAIVGYVFGKYL